MRILVTGSGGFLGGHLFRVLKARGHEVWGMDKKDGESTSNWSILHHFVKRFQPDLIAHLGANCSTAVSLRDPAVDFQDNVEGTFNVCEVSRHHGNIPILFTSTCKVHPGADGLIAPLGASKRVAEEYLRMYQDTYGIPVVIDRPSTVYGPGQDGTSESGWFTWFIKAALTKHQIELAGDGTQSRDVLYVDDFLTLVVDQIENFGQYAGGTYPVGGGPENEVTLNELLDALAYRNVVHVPRLPGDLQRVVTDNTAASNVRGWVPAISWRYGLHRTKESIL